MDFISIATSIGQSLGLLLLGALIYALVRVVTRDRT
jgi:hypothetical protein